jgi:hypothetical protein
MSLSEMIMIGVVAYWQAAAISLPIFATQGPLLAAFAGPN